MRKKSPDKKARIIDAVIEMLNKEGFEHLSLSKLAKAADISSATIYTYFESKEDMLKKIFAEVVYNMYQDMYFGVEKKATVKQKIVKIMTNFYNYSKNNTNYILFFIQALGNPVLSSVAHSIIRGNIVNNVFKEGIEKGDLRKTSPEFLQHFLLSGFFRVIMERITDKKAYFDIHKAIEMGWSAVRNTDKPDDEPMPDIKSQKW